MAGDLDRPVAQVALAWLMARPGTTSTLVGARSVAQLKSNIAATDISLSAEHMARLNEASAPPVGFSTGLTKPMIRRMIFGGQDVTGWGERGIA